MEWMIFAIVALPTVAAVWFGFYTTRDEKWSLARSAKIIGWALTGSALSVISFAVVLHLACYFFIRCTS